MKSITDKAEVSIDFPDKAYMGSFGRESAFEVKVEPDEVLLHIVREGDERRQVAVHLHYYLLADILSEIGEGLAEENLSNRGHIDALRGGVDVLAKALKKQKPKSRDKKRTKIK